MDWKSIDLNLLVVFDALLEAGSVTLAGRRLGLSQPAMSYSLSRLRKTFNDPLFIRISNRMRPTPRAGALAAPIREILDKVRNDLLQIEGFSPALTKRTFVFCMSDIGEMVFLPGILRTMMKLAPNAALRTVYLSPATLEEAMEAGEVDLAIGYFPDLRKAGVYQQRLSTSGFVCMARSRNPHFRNGITLSRFLDAPHVCVRAPGRSQELFEKHLEKAGITRRVLLTVPHFLSLLEIVPQSDLIATVPRMLADTLARTADIKVHALPMASPTFAVRQYWHRRVHEDAANQWIRAMVRDLFQKKT